MIGVGLGAAVIALAAAFLIWAAGARRPVPARVAITTAVLTLMVNAVLTIFFLMCLVGMHST